MRRDECRHREAIGGQRAPGVETEPSHPEQSRAGHAEDDIVRRHVLARMAHPLAEKERGDQRRGARRDVDDGAAREIERAELMEPSVDAPYPMRERIVDEDRPEHGEHQKAAEGHPLGDRAGDQCGSDDCEHTLIHHVCLMRHGGRISGEWLGGAHAG